MIIAVTGHQRIPDSILHEVESGVRASLRRLREDRTAASGEPATVMSCLAVGADQLVARLALDEGFRLEAVVPSAGYESVFDESGVREYRRLLALGSSHVVSGYDHPCGEAYMAAGRYMVDRCDRLLALWDGRPADSLGGTGDVVEYARSRGVPIDVVWRRGVLH